MQLYRTKPHYRTNTEDGIPIKLIYNDRNRPELVIDPKGLSQKIQIESIKGFNPLECLLKLHNPNPWKNYGNKISASSKYTGETFEEAYREALKIISEQNSELAIKTDYKKRYEWIKRYSKYIYNQIPENDKEAKTKIENAQLITWLTELGTTPIILDTLNTNLSQHTIVPLLMLQSIVIGLYTLDLQKKPQEIALKILREKRYTPEELYQNIRDTMNHGDIIFEEDENPINFDSLQDSLNEKLNGIITKVVVKKKEIEEEMKKYGRKIYRDLPIIFELESDSAIIEQDEPLIVKAITTIGITPNQRREHVEATLAYTIDLNEIEPEIKLKGIEIKTESKNPENKNIIIINPQDIDQFPEIIKEYLSSFEPD